MTCFGHVLAGPTIESKGMRAIFNKKGKKKGKKRLKTAKKGKIFENLGKNVQNLKIFLKRAGLCMIIAHSKQLENALHSQFSIEN